MNELQIIDISPEEFSEMAWKHFDCSKVFFLNPDFRKAYAKSFKAIPKSYLLKSGKSFIAGFFGYQIKQSLIPGRFLRGNMLLLNPKFIKKNSIIEQALRSGLIRLFENLKKEYEEIVFEIPNETIDLRGVVKDFDLQLRHSIILTKENSDYTWLSDSVKKKLKRNPIPNQYLEDLTSEEKGKPVETLLDKKLISKQEGASLKNLLQNSKELLFQKLDSGILVSYQEQDGRCINLFNWDDPSSKDNPTLLQYYANIQLLEQGTKSIDRGGANLLSISNFKESFGGELKANLKFTYRNRKKKMKDLLGKVVKKATRNN